MVEDGFLGGAAGIGRIEEWCNRGLQREPATVFHRGALDTEEYAAEQYRCQCILE
jgi:hypothetical protein